MLHHVGAIHCAAGELGQNSASNKSYEEDAPRPIHFDPPFSVDGFSKAPHGSLSSVALAREPPRKFSKFLHRAESPTPPEFGLMLCRLHSARPPADNAVSPKGSHASVANLVQVVHLQAINQRPHQESVRCGPAPADN